MPKQDPPVLDIIIGMHGAGKSKIISKNPYMTRSFRADADTIKKELSEIFNCNINSPLLHELSAKIRDEALKIAINYKCSIVIEKIGKSQDSLFELIDEVGVEYIKNLR